MFAILIFLLIIIALPFAWASASKMFWTTVVVVDKASLPKETNKMKTGHGRLAFYGYNCLINIPIVAVTLADPSLAWLGLLMLPFVYLNIRGRLQNIGWNAGLTWLWALGACVPILGQVLGLVLVFTPGKQPETVFLPPVPTNTPLVNPEVVKRHVEAPVASVVAAPVPTLARAFAAAESQRNETLDRFAMPAENPSSYDEEEGKLEALLSNDEEITYAQAQKIKARLAEIRSVDEEDRILRALANPETISYAQAKKLTARLEQVRAKKKIFAQEEKPTHRSGYPD